jgi:phenylalanyl-tRNA synthetase alpha chain
MESLKNLSLEAKREFGPLLNALKNTCQEYFNVRKAQLEQEEQAAHFAHFKNFDVTTSRDAPTQGSLHVFTKIIEELEDIFISMGFAQVSGPEVDTEFYNFQALNIPPDHPARATHDTFWLTTPGLLLRTHTSTLQIHAMEHQRPPLAIFAPGRCFRNEATDATHDFMFMQYECLLIDKKIAVADLIATAQGFLQSLFHDESITIRVRPGYFPFVEPGLEIDASCPFCKNGCSVCKKTRWIELLGSGLVHPNVLRSVGIDPTVYSGFAFGGGLERLAMIKYGITDIRLLRASPLNFLEQWT